MSEPNSMNNDYYYVCRSTYPEDFNFEDNNPPIYMPVNVQSQPRIQDFLPPATSFSLSDNVDEMSMNNMDYGDTGTYTGNYAPYQGNFSKYAHQGNADTMNDN